MGRWKACVYFSLKVTELIFLSLTVKALQDKTCQNSLIFGGGEPRFKAEGARPGECFFGLSNTRHILLSFSEDCSTFSRSDTIPVCDGRTDRQMDGRYCSSYYSACNASIAGQAL